MKIKKRDGRIVDFDRSKIELAVLKAFRAVDGNVTLFAKQKAENIAHYIEAEAEKSDKILDVEKIGDLTEKGLMATKRKDVAKAYILYREKRNLARKNTIDDAIRELVGGQSDYWKYENSNKNSTVVTTQRDYLAGIVSTDYARRYILPKDVVEAHDEGYIHFHDIDYMTQQTLHNCELINLDDMLQNGTVVNGVMIEKPHRLITASTICTQIIAAVCSSSFGLPTKAAELKRY